MKRLLSLVAFFATLQASAQQVNPVPDYVFRNQMSVGRGTVTDTAAYFSIGPRYGANKGFMPPIVGDTATFSSGKRNGLLIFSVQKNKFLYWDSVRVQWSDMAGSSGTYITGTGITGYVPQFNGTTTIDTSALFTLGSRLGIGSSTFAYTSTNTANVELNGTSGGILGFKRNDSARGYLWHTGDNMELANTTAGAISFNTNSATRGSISSAGVWRLHNLAGTGDRVVVASSNGTLSASTSVTGLVDTTTISKRAWRQKGDDSLGAIIATKGSGTVTSVATGYGLSGGTITTTGTLLVDTLNIATRAWRQKGLDSLAALEVSGSGTTNYVPKFTAASTIGNSQIFDNGTNVGVGTASPISSSVLDIVSSTNIYPRIRSTGTGEAFQFYQNSTSGTTAGDGLFVGINSGNDAFFYNSEATPARFFTSATERMRITSGGDVGIGTANPASYTGYRVLEVQNTNGAGFRLKNSAETGVFEMLTNSTETYIKNVTNTQLTFGTNNTERLRIFANGRVGVNTTTDAGYQFDINGTLRSVNGANFATSSGNVGIGGASPQAKLDVYGAFRVSSATFNIPPSGAGIEYSFRPGDSTGYVLTFSRDYNSYRNQRYFALTHRFSTSNSELDALYINSNQETLINTTTDAGDYKLQVAGNIYNTGSAVLAATSGNVGINRTSTGAKLDVQAESGAWGFFLRNNVGNTIIAARNDGRFLVGNGTVDNFAVTETGNVGIGTTSPAYLVEAYKNGLADVIVNSAADNNSAILSVFNSGGTSGNFAQLRAYGNTTGGTLFGSSTNKMISLFSNGDALMTIGTISATSLAFGTSNAERARFSDAGELLINTTTDAGDYKLQVVGNARVGTGKLDISSNTTFSMNVQRSGTSEVAGTFNNSNGILYLGAESSTGGSLFTGSSAYAAVIGSGAAYPLQFATNNVTRATINTGGELLINTTTDNGDFKLQLNGNALILGSIKTANGASSTAQPWHLGSVVATNVQLDTANYVEVEINGVYYRLAIVTPL